MSAMINRKYEIILAVFLCNIWAAIYAAESSLLDVNYRNLIARADLTYTQPVKQSEAGMPVGNGRMGSLVWTSPTALRLQINRVDIFGNSAASNNFYERHTDYCGGCGFVDVDFVDYGEDVFTDHDFRQHLSCYDGVVTVEGKGIKVDVLAWDAKDVMAIRVSDSRENPSSIRIRLRMLRAPITKKGNHAAISKLDILKDHLVLTQSFTEDDFYCGSSVVIGVTGRSVNAKMNNETELQLSAEPGLGTFTIFISSAASFDKDEDITASAVTQLDTAMKQGFEGVAQSTKTWWHDFWQRAFVHLHSTDAEADLLEQHYNYYLYVMGSSSRGQYPTKFNGMLWITGGDTRKWGGQYWGANQSCLYNALFPTNRIELMDPLFKMYTGMAASCALAAKQQWGSQGLYIPETMAFDGLPKLPDDIAEEMRDLYLCRKPWAAKSQHFMDYARTKLPFASRWNWKSDIGFEKGEWRFGDKGGGTFGHVTHIFSRGAKIAYKYWLKYEYTLDKEWLRNEAYPMIKGVAEFYRNFPNVQKGPDGKYSIFNVNDNEAVWCARNTVEEISSMRGIFPVVIKASEILNVDADMRPLWQEFLDNLSPLTLSSDDPMQDPSRSVIWVKSIGPTVRGNGFRPPDENTMPVWYFDLCNLEADPATLEIANNTFNTYFRNGINAQTRVGVLSKLGAAGAILGRTEATRYLLPNQIRTNEREIAPLSNRMDLREGVQTTSVQRLGRVADALNDALCQSVPAGPAQHPVIRVFPAWPKEWDADFTLLCRDGFLVTSSMQNSDIPFVEIHSQTGSDCRIHNPWPGKVLTIYRNGKKAESSDEDLLVFKTGKEERLVLVPEGLKPEQLKRVVGE